MDNKEHGQNVKFVHKKVQFVCKNKAIKTILFADKESKDKEKEKNAALAVPRLSVCADAQKVDRAKLAQTEVIFLSYIRLYYPTTVNTFMVNL